MSVPQLSVEIRVIEVARRKPRELYMNIEADLLQMVSNRTGSLPSFNRQWEPGKENKYE